MVFPTTQQFDALKEIVNIGVGRAASSLNEMLEAHIELKVPSLCIFNPNDPQSYPSHLDVGKLSCVQMSFLGKFNGRSALVFPPESAIKLVSTLTGQVEGTPEMDAVMMGTLNEVGNILLNGVMGTVANVLEVTFDYTFPNYSEAPLDQLILSSDPNLVLLAQTNFEVKSMEIAGHIFLFFELSDFEKLIKMLSGLFGDQ